MLLTVIMPAVLAFVMFGIGLSIHPSDFMQIAKRPRTIAIGLVCQLLILPLLAYALTHVFALAPAYSIGLMILAASPGGPTANLLSHLAGGAVVINVALTAISSVVSIFSLPIMIHWSLSHFLGPSMAEGTTVPLDTTKLIQTMLIVILPMAGGVWISNRPKLMPDAFKNKLKRLVSIVSIVLIVLLVIGAIFSERETVAAAALAVGWCALTFNLGSVLTGYFIPRLFKLEQREAVAIAFEVGIHNGAMAMALAANPVIVDAVRASLGTSGAQIGDLSIAFPAAIYAALMYGSAGLLVWISKRNRTRPASR